MKTIAIIGTGPGGLMAAERLGAMGYKIDIYDHKPTPARKFLIAGLGGLNITHSEHLEKFLTRYGEAKSFLSPIIQNFTPDDLRNWCHELGEETFVGTSGRVFPKTMKASPLLRAWLNRLKTYDITLHINHHWIGWDEDNNLLFSHSPSPYPSPDGRGKPAMNGWRVRDKAKPNATILALGGASWPKLGSDGSWQSALEQYGIGISPFRPTNCGFKTDWSEIFKQKFAGTPLKSIALSHKDKTITTEIMISENGLEGSGIYAFSKFIREDIEQNGQSKITIDLKPDLSEQDLETRLSRPQCRDSKTNFIRKHTGLSPVAINLLYECGDKTKSLAHQIKNIEVTLTETFPIDRAISSAGGIKLSELDENLMLKKLPSVFAIGEMLDWEAPTGGYLLQATFSTGVFVAKGVDKYLKAANI